MPVIWYYDFKEYRVIRGLCGELYCYYKGYCKDISMSCTLDVCIYVLITKIPKS